MLVEVIPLAERTRVAVPFTESVSGCADICTGWGKFQLLESNCKLDGPLKRRSLSPEIAKFTVTLLVG